MKARAQLKVPYKCGSLDNNSNDKENRVCSLSLPLLLGYPLLNREQSQHNVPTPPKGGDAGVSDEGADKEVLRTQPILYRILY